MAGCVLGSMMSTSALYICPEAPTQFLFGSGLNSSLGECTKKELHESLWVGHRVDTATTKQKTRKHTGIVCMI